MATLLEGLRYLPPLVVLLIAVILVAGETGVVVGLLFPVEITLMTVGFLAYQGAVPFWLAMVLMLAAAGVGDALALRSGRKYGPRVRASRLGGWVGEPRWTQADRLLRRLGGRSAFVARWVPFARTLLPRLAGSAGMPYRAYAPWNYAGVVTAVGSSVALGYLAGASYARVAESFGRATTAVLLLALTAGGVVIAGRWLGRHPRPGRDLLHRVGAVPALRRIRQAAPDSRWWTVADLAAALVAWSSAALALFWAVRFVVRYSGLADVDSAVAGWFARSRSGVLIEVAEVGATAVAVVVLASLVVLLPVALFTTVVDRRRALGGVAALLVLAATMMLAGGGGSYSGPPPAGGFSGSGAAVIAGAGVLCWVFTRRAGWVVATVLWGSVAVTVMVLVAARLYLGWDPISGAAMATVLAAAWVVLLSVAGRDQRERVTRSVTIYRNPSSHNSHKLRSPPIPES